MADFGSTLRSIIKICGVKSYILAGALGYDPSYLSKWFSNAKRPSSAMINSTAETIADICVRDGDAEAIAKLAREFQISEVNPLDKPASAKMIKNIIIRSFFETEREGTIRRKDVSIDMFQIDIDMVCDQLAANIDREKRNYDLIIPLNVFKQSIEKKPELLAFFKIGTSEKQQVSVRLFYSENVFEKEGSMEGFILSLSHIFYNSNMQLYYVSMEDYAEYGNMCVLNDCFAILGIKDPFTGEVLCSNISNHTSVEKIYNSMLTYLYKQANVFDYTKSLSEKSRNYSYKYASHSSHFYILGEMFPIYMDSVIQKLVFNMQLSPAADESCKNFYYEYTGTTTVFIFESVLLNYFVTGHMRINNTRHVVLDREERKHHIETILERMEKRSGLELYILRDTNPVLKANDCCFSTFSTTDVSLIIDSNDQREIYYITSDKGCSIVNSLIARLRDMPDNFLLGRERSIEYIKNLLRII